MVERRAPRRVRGLQPERQRPHRGFGLLGAADARCAGLGAARLGRGRERRAGGFYARHDAQASRSEEHTSELQSLAYLVCRLLLEKKKEELETRHAIVGNAITP